MGDAERISQEAPVVLLHEDRQEIRLGGAANVVHMLQGLDCQVTVAGVVGRDVDGQQLRTALEEIGANCELVLEDDSRPTTVKQRFLGRAQFRHPHQMLRVDRETRQPLGTVIEDRLLEKLRELLTGQQAVLVSDYAKGVCTPKVLSVVIAAAREKQIPVIVDPASGVDYNRYFGATAITPNRLETSRATGISVNTADDAFRAGRQLCNQLQLDHAFVTLDSDGIALVQEDGKVELFPTRKREVYDITGAGDMVLAAIGMGAAEAVPPAELAKLANTAGGLEVEQIGVVTVSRDEILADLLRGTRSVGEKVCSLAQLDRHAEMRRKLGQRVVLTNGCFDLLHAGHVTYLEDAAREGDCLIVAMNSDSSVRSLAKGANRPIIPENQRMLVLAALQAVDYVVLFDESTPHEVIRRLKPDLLVKGGTYQPHEIVGHELVATYGGQVKSLSVVEGISTTAVLERIRNEEPPQNASLPFSSPMRRAG